VDCQKTSSKMVRSLSQWTKTLSFPARISPNRHSKDCSVNVHPITPTTLQPPPTPPRKSNSNSSSSSSSSSPSPTTQQNVPITEISQIVSFRLIFRQENFLTCNFKLFSKFPVKNSATRAT
jgi:hypothetical protein